MTRLTTVSVETSRSCEAIDITDSVLAAVVGRSGALLVSAPHTTVALVLSEVDSELLRDHERVAEDLVSRWEPFQHRRNGVPNAAAHIVSSMYGTSFVIMCDDGHLDLGSYQRIVLIELDGPKSRSVHVSSLG